MAPTKKREARENNYYNVGVQGRKTGITLEDKGVYDEYGLEPVSGIFSSPERSPPKRGEEATGSGSMEIQNSSMPDLTTSHQILRNSRTNLPPPRSRSPKKTNLGSSPRRQSSMAPRSSLPPSSPVRDSSQPIARRLDFEQDESSLHETPALSGSGARRGAKRSDVYDIPEDEPEDEPEDGSPAPDPSAIFEESIQEEIANESVVAPEESFVAQIGDDSMANGEAVEELEVEEVQQESEIVREPPKEKAKRGRKRKSDVVEVSEEEQEAAEPPRKRGRTPKEASESQRSRKNAPTLATERRRSQRVSDISEIEAPIDDSVDQSDQVEEPVEEPVALKRRGRPPKAQPNTEQKESVVEAPVDDPVDQSEQVDEAPAPKKRGRLAKAQPNGDEAAASASSSKPAKPAPVADKSGSGFARPEKPRGRPKANASSSNPTSTETKAKSAPKPKDKSKDKTPQAESSEEAGKLVDVHGNPLSKKDIDQISATSGGSRFGRGRHLSVFREMNPDNVARVGRTGRHRVAPIDFWKNDHISYEPDGSMSSIVKSQAIEEERRVGRKAYKTKGKKKMVVEEEEEVERDPWEEEGTLVGNFRGFDPVGEVASGEIVEDAIAWTPNGVQPRDVGDGGFKYAKIGSVGNFFNWGLIELGPDQMKRTKNSRYMHMIFNVQQGVVEVRMHENEFVVRKNGVWQVPRGNTYSIKNIGSGTARVFFSQARELHVDDAE
ncbi:hypothetical protein G6011_00900 [Alternaria panax]|uniref:CENP-C homolog n=1 Tax=Alternaria panax TaxID=48097 RepID=A0AAD4IJR3_9PLEO|nr:hypothetical protein G6011_00900 [Alternaria panax]